jgi:hypothetical protein
MFLEGVCETQPSFLISEGRHRRCAASPNYWDRFAPATAAIGGEALTCRENKVAKGGGTYRLLSVLQYQPKGGFMALGGRGGPL